MLKMLRSKLDSGLEVEGLILWFVEGGHLELCVITKVDCVCVRKDDALAHHLGDWQ